MTLLRLVAGSVSPVSAAPAARNDSDGDLVVNTADVDDDNDGIPDLHEIAMDRSDRHTDGDGMPDFLQRVNDQSCCDLDGDGTDDQIPVNSDSGDLPDFQDLDSDNDGLADIVELGGIDSDNDGHVDHFIDIAGGPDGTDDGLLAFPYTPRDVNGNAVYDHVEYVPSGNPESAPDVDAESGEDTVGMQPDSQADPQPVVESDSQPQEDDQPSVEPEGFVRTGLNASGCSIASSSSDPILALLAMISFAMLLRRFTLGRGPNE